MALPLLTLFTNVIRAGLEIVRTKAAGGWFRKLVKQQVVRSSLRGIRKPGQILSESEKTTFWRRGSLYFFVYNPKHKLTLPYYDTFPLVLPIEKYSDGFLGINFHYLYPKDRAILLDQLQAFANNKELDETTRLHLTYTSLGNFTKLKRAKPCIKRYLNMFIKSQMVTINPSDWGTAIFLPVERFKKMNKTMVWAESAAAFRNIHA
jgi:hypothetical protein|tara:strand:- start:387 stop:1004 length:618 start_codon:yes stop_codon:yes gene_type:complete